MKNGVNVKQKNCNMYVNINVLRQVISQTIYGDLKTILVNLFELYLHLNS